MTPYDAARQFVDQAAKDEVAAGKFVGDLEIADEIIGFHLQQAAEKLMKAVLAAAVIPVPRTHDLTLLIDLLAVKGMPLPAQLDAVRRLTPFAVEFRYTPLPTASGPLDRAGSVDLVARLRVWAEGQIKAAAPPPPPAAPAP